MAKFKVGQMVKVKRTKQPVKIMAVYELPRDFKKFIRDMKMGDDLTPNDFDRHTQYVIKPNDEGDWVDENELFANSVASSNPVVANALAATTNASIILSEGDEIRDDGKVYTVIPGGNSWAYKVRDENGSTKLIASGNIKEYRLKTWKSRGEGFVQNALAAAARNAFYKTEEEAEYRAKTFIDSAISRIKGDIDSEISTVSDCVKLFKGAPMSDKAKSDLERLKAHIATLKKCKSMF